jgi:hypothetical protein
MARKKLALAVKSKRHFKAIRRYSGPDQGTREMYPLHPFVISGGKVTERYYFQHLSNVTEYKFQVEPKYFGKESNYTIAFPKYIRKILKGNPDAKIFCVFDWDTVHGNNTNLKKHKDFKSHFKEAMDNGRVVLCPSMPSIEYWLLLHFCNITRLIPTCQEAAKLLQPYMESFFKKKGANLYKSLKSEQVVMNPTWVIALCADGKLELAIKRAEDNINAAIAANDLENQSFSFVYRVFREYR